MKNILLLVLISNFSVLFSSDCEFKELQKINGLVDELVADKHQEGRDRACEQDKERTKRRHAARDYKSFRQGDVIDRPLELAYLERVSRKYEK
jgi:hypothetical protein